MISREHLYLSLILISIIGVASVTIYLTFFQPNNEFYSDFNSAKNHTLRDINVSMTTIDKNQIIEANCKAYAVDYREECERTLIKEIFQNKSMT